MRLLAILITAVLLTASAGPEPPYIYYFPLVFKSTPESASKGIAIFYTAPACDDAARLRAGWWYNWQSSPLGQCAAGFVPMLYDARMLDDPWHVANLLRYGAESGYILGYNEPNLAGQDNVTPAEGAAGWRRLEELTAGTGIKLVSPAPNQFAPGVADPYGYTWLLAMVREYEARYHARPRFDAIAWHYYGSASTAKKYLTARRNELEPLYPGAPVWLTEFNGCLIGGYEPAGYMAELLPWLAATPWVARYSWFIARPVAGIPDTASACTLLTADGRLTPAGAVYRGY